mgnify:CR=1 FL=1
MNREYTPGGFCPIFQGQCKEAQCQFWVKENCAIHIIGKALYQQWLAMPNEDINSPLVPKVKFANEEDIS